MRSANHVAAIGLVSILTFGSVGAITLSQPAIANQGQAQQTGTFVGVDHPAEGKAHIVTNEGKNYLVFDDAFQSHEGPDLFVLLHRSEVPESYAETDYVNLGVLQKVNGMQVYEIPADVDLSTFKSAVVWCREFNVTFGYAPF
ncbi:MAG: DM13 domain-containing protein [Cyanobacteria bacterium P01_A01_bin.17]